MPKKIYVRGHGGMRLEAELPTSMELDPNAPEKTFKEQSVTLKIKNFKVEGDVDGIPSGTVFEVKNGDCAVTFEYE